ncbi:hypothetical protein C8R47DRAFT_288682 [Mycena vitilis]|nr:hypothetical protein C8R47DRAFT_288682 [Mycena vitilis]
MSYVRGLLRESLKGPFAPSGSLAAFSPTHVSPPSIFLFIAMGEFDQTIGFTLLGVTVNTYLAGVIMPQFFTYWSSAYKDPWWTMWRITLLFIVNGIQAATVLHMAWFYCVTNFTNPNIFATTLWPFPFTALLTAILALTNQMFQSWRIYQFTRNKVLASLISAISLASCGMGVTVAIEWWSFSEPSRLVSLRPIVEANLALQLAIDVIVSVILAVIFTKFNTGFPPPRTMLKSLVRNVVQSGSFTAIFAIGALFSFRFSPGAYMLPLFALPIGRLYTHTMMDYLISREEPRDILMNDGSLVSVPTLPYPLFNGPRRDVETLGEVDGAGIMLRDTSSSSAKATNILDLARGSSGQSDILGRDKS